MNPKKLGDFGERIACYYLENKGYKILARNYSKKWSGGPKKGEIDIVAEPLDTLGGKKDNTIHFIEVKTLTSTKKGGFFPEDKVNFQKQRQIIKIAQDWLLERKIPLESKWQIDVVSIKVDLDSKKAKVKHLENAISS